MLKADELEKFLYWIISLLINLIILTFMSTLLLINVNQNFKTTTINIILQEEKPEPKVSGFQITQKKLSGKADKKVSVQPGMPKPKTMPHTEHGDYSVPANQEEVSILSQIEESVKRRKLQQEGMPNVKEIGNIIASYTSSGISISTTGSRKVVSIPTMPKIVSDEPLSNIKVKIWVEPSGVVSRVEILQRSGSSQVDRQVVNFVKSIRFEAINGDIQTGIITFKLIGG